MKVLIVGNVRCPYITSGKTYDVIEHDELESVAVMDDEGDVITLLTERCKGYWCNHLGPSAKAVFVD